MSVSGAGQLTLLFTMFAHQLPMLLVCVIAIGLVLTGRHQKSPALPWALMGFGLMFLCFAVPVCQWIVQTSIMSSGGAAAAQTGLYNLISFVFSILQALAYGLLAMAIF